MAELIPSVLFPSLIDKRYFLFHPNVELIQIEAFKNATVPICKNRIVVTNFRLVFVPK
jgi:hypothetical protein